MEKLNLDEGIPKNPFIHRIGNYKTQLNRYRREGLKRGHHTGFKSLYDKYSVKEGSTTFIIASPAVGKTAILYEVLINLATYSKWKIAIFSPEGGAPADLFAELLWAYLGRPFLKTKDIVHASDAQVEAAYNFMEEHFYIIDAGLKEINAESYYRAVQDIEEEDNVKLNACVIDPIVELNINPDNKREDIALGSFLTKVRKFSAQFNIHTFIAIHTKAMQPLKTTLPSGEDIFYYPQPTFYDTMGGQMWSRKGMMVMSLWRPPEGMLNPKTDEPYERNETVIEILKVKPKIMGTVGRISLFYDYNSSRFYEKDTNGNKTFASDILSEEEDEYALPF